VTLILVRSPKGGVGSTFITAQLAIRLAEQGLRVTAIDCTGQDSLKLHFGLRPAQPLGMPGEAWPQAHVVLGVELMSSDALQRAIVSGPGLAHAIDAINARTDLRVAPPEAWRPTAADAADLATRLHAAGRADAPAALVPDYLRPTYADESAALPG
jgi:cellulose biosynthesis protein BcsQ